MTPVLKHMAWVGLPLLLVGLTVRQEQPQATQQTAADVSQKKPTDQRSFRMGFTSWPYAATPKAISDTYAFLGANGDLIAEHIEEGVPWIEASQDKPFPQTFVEKMEGRRKNRPKGTKLLLSITPFDMGRRSLADLVNATGKQPLPKDWREKRFNDPTVRKAYRNYVLWMTDFFKPDYLITGIESNELLNNTPEEWKNYLELSRYVRSEVKRAHPTLPVAESVTLHKLLEAGNRDLENYQKAIKSFVSEHDYFGVSFYPFLLGQHSPKEFSDALAFLPKFIAKPIAITETGHPAEDLVVKKFGLNFPATLNEQSDYVSALLAQAQANRYLFVTYFTWKDFDELWKTFPEELKDIGRLWRDTGLVSEQDELRPARRVWQNYFALPFSDPSEKAGQK